MHISSINTGLDLIPSIGREVRFSFPSNLSIAEIIQQNKENKLKLPGQFSFAENPQSSAVQKTSNIFITKGDEIFELDQTFERIISQRSTQTNNFINLQLSKLFVKYLEIEEIERAAQVADHILCKKTLNSAAQQAMQFYFSKDLRALQLKKVFDLFMACGDMDRAIIIAFHIFDLNIDISKPHKIAFIDIENRKASDIQTSAFMEICHYYLEHKDFMNAIHYSKYSGRHEALVFFEAIKLLIDLEDFHQAFILAKVDHSFDTDEKIFYLSQIYKFYSQSNQLAEAEEVLQELSRIIIANYSDKREKIFKILLLLELTDIAENFVPHLPIEYRSLAFAELFKEYTIQQKDLYVRELTAKKIENPEIRDLALIELYMTHIALKQFHEAAKIESKIRDFRLIKDTDKKLEAFFKSEGKNEIVFQIAIMQLDRVEKRYIIGKNSDTQLDTCCCEASEIYFKIEEYNKAIQFVLAIKNLELKIKSCLALSKQLLEKNELEWARYIAPHALNTALLLHPKYTRVKKQTAMTVEQILAKIDARSSALSA